MSRIGLQASGWQAMSAEHHAELVARYGELIRGFQRPRCVFRPEARSPKPEA